MYVYIYMVFKEIKMYMFQLHYSHKTNTTKTYTI